MKANLNRLRPFKPYDEQHFNTDHMVPMEEDIKAEADDTTEIDIHDFHAVGDLVMIDFGKGEHEPFGIGRILLRRNHHDNGHLVQWYSNRAIQKHYEDKRTTQQPDLTGPYLPGWTQPAQGGTKHYFRTNRSAGRHEPYTNDTNSVTITDDHISQYDIALDDSNKLTPRVVALLRETGHLPK